MSTPEARNIAAALSLKGIKIAPSRVQRLLDQILQLESRAQSIRRLIGIERKFK